MSVVLPLCGCRPAGPHPVAWRELAVPGSAAVTAIASGPDLLVATHPDGDAIAPPTLYRVDQRAAQADATGPTEFTWHPIELRSQTYYGARAALLWISQAGGRINAIGRAVGGAHSIPRYTSWQGDVDGVQETKQTFETFGGPDAIAVCDLASGSGGDVAVGSWSAGGRPAGVSAWSAQGPTWLRDDDAPGLRSTTTDLTVPDAIVARGSGFAIAGISTMLGDGRIDTRATVFFADRVSAGRWNWRRIVLDRSGPDSEALDVACVDRVCTITGVRGDRLAVWQLDQDDHTRAVDVPDAITVTRSPGLPGVVAGSVGDAVWVAVQSGDHAVLIRDSDWTTKYAGPPGTVVAMAAAGGSLALVTQDDQGRRHLWLGSPDGAGGGGAGLESDRG